MGRIASSLMGNKRRHSNTQELLPREPLKRLRLDENRKESDVAQQSEEQNIVDDAEQALDIKEVRNKLQEFIIHADSHKLKETVWKNDAIDMFLQFTSSDADPDYRFAGHCLSAVVKLYLLRIDLLYEDVTRFSALFRSKDKRSRQRDDDNDQPENTDNNPPRQPRRSRVKKTATISSPESLNAKLITTAAADPFFAKLNTHVGSTKANRMLQNMLTSKNSSLKMSVHDKFWDSDDQIDFRASPDPIEQPIHVKVPITQPESIQSKVIRSTLAEYRMTEKRLDEHNVSVYIDLCESDVEMEEYNNEEVPMSAGSDDEGIIDEMANDADFCYNDFETSIENQVLHSTQAAIAAIDSGYHTQASARTTPQFIEDFEPLDGKELEYSYRPLDFISNYYAGPCHWKFLKTSRTRKALIAPKRKIVREKVTLESLMKFDFGQSLIQRDSELKKVRVQNWSCGALMLPQDFHVQPDFFEEFNHSRLNIDDPIVGLELEEEEGFQHFDEHFDEHEFEQTTATEPTQGFPMPMNTTSFRFTQNRPMSIQEITDTSMTVIETEACLTQCSAVNFSAVYSKVDKLVREKPGTSNYALTFLSLLHAAAEKKVELQQNDNIMDFTILLKP